MATATLISKPRDRWTRFGAEDEGRLRLLGQHRAGSLPVPVPGFGRPVTVQLAATRSDWEQAFELVANNYQACGYEDGDCDYRFTSYHALPDTAVFVAKDCGRVVATFSLVPDNHLLGLPVEKVYAGEIEELRRHGRRLAEVTSLASRDLSLREFMRVFPALIRLMMQYHIRHGGDSWVIHTTPQHRAYYCKTLGFLPLAASRAVPSVCGTIGQPCLLDLPRMKARAPRAYQDMFGTPLPTAALRAVPLPAEHVHRFSAHSSQIDPRFAAEILAYVEDCGSPRRW